MKLHVHLKTGEVTVDEIIEGENAEAVVKVIQQRVAQKASFLVAAFVKQMTPLAFAQEATRRFNNSTKENVPLPATCEDFLQMGIEKKFATLVES